MVVVFVEITRAPASTQAVFDDFQEDKQA